MNPSSFVHAYRGSLLADALAMPVHWYYDTAALDRDYGSINDFISPKEPHADSILWRSQYIPTSPEFDLLGQQKEFWGQRGIHYHRNLRAGDNTVNFQLARHLYHWVVLRGGYDGDAWLSVYIDFMTKPEQHRDTYLEEYHRNFFQNLGRGQKPRRCASPDIHIGGLATVPALTAALVSAGIFAESKVCQIVREHVGLTHASREVAEAADLLVRLLFRLAEEESFENALQKEATGLVGLKRLKSWEGMDDRKVVGSILSPACYLPESMVASLFLVWKYQGRFASGLQANAEVGGDNCHRGAVVGALLGAIGPIPQKWESRVQF